MIVKRRRNKILHWFFQPFVGAKRGEHQADMTLLIVVACLIFFGLIFLSSASSNLAFYKFGDTYKLLKQQIVHGLLPGLVLFYFALRLDYHIYKRFIYFFLALSFLLLILVFLTNFGAGFGTANSWIVIGGLAFQPSELVKLLLIVFLAIWFDKIGEQIRNKKTVIFFLVILALISLLLIKQPDLGTLVIIILVALAMFYVAGARLLHLGSILLAAFLAFIALVITAPYRMNRVRTWFNPNLDPQGIGWQIQQSLIAIGSGGWFGTGLGSSKQKSYLPQPANDSIFAVIAEEIGFVFSLLFLFLFFALLKKGFQIAKNADDNFGKLLAIGISVWLGLQVFINIAGMIQLAPLTGVPLPFVSLGGTNLVVSLISVGILANISRHANT
ncbi:MAG: putative peptidoglycan glycosyltransferase FtsW [bacterium]|nr:putative peptidoglycan glycosyltransferase FtsW [bacterium]